MFWYNLITVMGDRATQECDPSTMAAPNGMGWYLFRFQPFMIMPVASKRKTPASLEAVDATFSPTFFDESQKRRKIK
jgi:hypothetical protein